MVDKIQYEPQDDDPELEVLIDNWEEYKLQLDIAKKHELDSRNDLCSVMFGKRQGEFKVEYEDDFGRLITANSKVNINIDNDVLGIDVKKFQEDTIPILAEYLDQLSDTELACFDIKVSLNKSRFDKLKSISDNLEDAITVTPATPTLSMKDMV